MNPWQRFWLVLRDLRVWYLCTFNPKYLEEQSGKMRGGCPKGCAACCEIVGCDKLDPNTKLCKDYENRPQFCRDFPVDKWDQ